jgi:hypothetical protein
MIKDSKEYGYVLMRIEATKGFIEEQRTSMLKVYKKLLEEKNADGTPKMTLEKIEKSLEPMKNLLTKLQEEVSHYEQTLMTPKVEETTNADQQPNS